MKQYCLYIVVNDDFIDGAIVAIYSFLKNNTWFNGDIVIGCLDKNGFRLSVENREKIGNLYYKTKFIDIKAEEFYDIFKNMSLRSMRNVGFEMVICKFQIFRMHEYDKVLCIDGDMLIVDDIRELFENDIEFGAAPDKIDDKYGLSCYSERTNEYFNSGILVVGKKYMTENVILECDEILRKWEENAICDVKHMNGLCPEQDVLNICFFNKEATLIPSKYNMDRFYCDENGCEGIKVIHYLTRNKPWFVFRGEFLYEGWTQIEWERYYNNYLEWLNYYIFENNGEVLKFPKKYEDKDKYLLVTCAKNENRYIREWIEHYVQLNFDKIIICDNNDDDSLYDVISDYIERDIVEIFKCRGLKNFQANIFAMFCTEGNYEWCGYFDCDEFLELGTYSDIKEYLKNKDGDCIAFNWLMFDSNGNIDYKDKPLAERFTIPYLPIMNIENAFVKCLMRGGHFKYGDVINDGGHMYRTLNNDKILYNFGGYCLSKLPGDNLQAILPLRYKDGYIKHYYTKSFEEWCDKSKRGWPDKYGVLPISRFFRLNNTTKYDRKKYSNTLFIDEQVFEKIHDLPDDFENIKFFIFWSDGCYDYAYTSRVMYAMYKCENVVFIIGGNGISDEQYNLLLECAFVTGNKIAYVNGEDEIQKVFKKYNKSDEIVTYWRKHI